MAPENTKQHVLKGFPVVCISSLQAENLTLNTCVTAPGTSAFHKSTAVSLKSQVLKAHSKCNFYRD